MQRFDVVVIGGGPAGATAAARLARGGASVAVLEKGPLGRDKPCGGGLTARAWAALDRVAPEVERIVGSTVASTAVRLGAERSMTMPHPGAEVRMVRRRDLDRLLLEDAVSAGAEVRTCQPARAIEMTPSGCTVRTAAGIYGCAHLLLATGSEGRLRAAVGLSSPRVTMAPALEIETAATVTSVARDQAILDFGVRRGYAWAFPKGEEWNVGILSLDRTVGPTLREGLARFAERAGVVFGSGDALAAVKGRRIPMWTGSAPVTSGRAAAIGDCAGLADAFFGEGISQALVSAHLAADAILTAPDSGALAAYEAAVTRRLRPHLVGMLAMSRIAYRWPGMSVRALERSSVFRSVVRRGVFGGGARHGSRPVATPAG